MARRSAGSAAGSAIAATRAWRSRSTAARTSLAIDLRTPEGRAVLYKLVPKVDVVIQNFVAGRGEEARHRLRGAVGDQSRG